MPGVFTIEERPDLGGFQPRSGSPIRFEWDAATRSAPRQPWDFGGQQRTNRVEYPGTDRPTEQIMGPNFTPFTLTGKWVDKFNTPGFAVETWEAFEQMCRRGNVVIVGFKQADKAIEFEGIITSWTFSYEHDAKIGYSFTVSPHQRRGASDEILAAPDTLKTIDQYKEDLEQAQALVEALNNPQQPAARGLTDDTYADMVQGVTASSSELAVFSNAIEQRVLDQELAEGVDLRRALGSVDSLIERCAENRARTAALRSDVSLTVKTVENVLNFEVWSRGTSSTSRQMIFDSQQVRKELDRRATPDALAFYRPHKNESLYGISTRFYGTPHNARLIAERNGIKEMVLTGTELLVIPEER